MTVAEFKRKWSRYQGKESSAYQEHFNDLCRLLGQKTPVEADPSGDDWFCFQKRVIKDLELLPIDADRKKDEDERGFADVWRKDCFGWEYKGKKKNLDEAYQQLQQYRESLMNPPLLVVCDFERFIVRTNFNGTVMQAHEFTLETMDQPKNWRILRALFEDPGFLRPVQTTAQVTEALAQDIADIARSLQRREAVELADAKTRAEMNFAQRRNLRIARFLNRVVFCFFAEDTGLLPKNLFSDVLKAGLGDLRHLAETMETLFATMAKGGTFGKDKIRHFNGHLFEDSTVFELTEPELKKLAEAGEADWQCIEPSIMGTLFERALEPEQRAQLGAHYTSEADIKTLVEPVLMAPLRKEWAELKASLLAAYARGRGTAEHRAKLAALQQKVARTVVLDPACGSGNFLYVSLQLLLGLEKEVVTFGTMLGYKFTLQTGVNQLRALEINPYAYELAQVAVQIGYLQWRRDNGFDNDRTPVLQTLAGFQNEDALLEPHFHNKARNLKEAQADEHKADNSLKFYTEREWPKCDAIVGNPPFLHGSKLLRELGDNYRANLFKTFEGRVEGFADLCCYWFEKSRAHIAAKKASRAGLLATQSIRGGASREVLKRIKETGDIFFAISDRDWILSGAAVHVSMVGFDNGTQTVRELDGRSVPSINSNLTTDADLTAAKRLGGTSELWAYGSQQKAKFDIEEPIAQTMLFDPNPHGLPNSDVVRPSFNATQFLRRTKVTWVIDFALEKNIAQASQYQKPFEYCRQKIFPGRAAHREAIQRNSWWLHARPSPEYRKFAAEEAAILVTPCVSKHRVFAFVDSATVPDHALIVFGNRAWWFFGVLHSRVHELWARAQATQVRERESGLRYTPKVCFETFPFPFPLKAEVAGREEPDWPRAVDAVQAEVDAARAARVKEPAGAYGTAELRAAIAAAAKHLNDLRERWLNPPEWTKTEWLEFPATVGGPWDRFIAPATVAAGSTTGTARYPRVVPKDPESAAALKGRTLTALYNERPAWLELAHQQLDAAVAAAYGWPANLTDDEILARLLERNLAQAKTEAEAEAAAGRRTGPRKAQRQKRDDELI